MDSATSAAGVGASGGPAPGELTEPEIQNLVARCPEQQRWAFEGWLRGVRHLDGDLITRPAK